MNPKCTYKVKWYLELFHYRSGHAYQKLECVLQARGVAKEHPVECMCLDDCGLKALLAEVPKIKPIDLLHEIDSMGNARVFETKLECSVA